MSSGEGGNRDEQQEVGTLLVHFSIQMLPAEVLSMLADLTDLPVGEIRQVVVPASPLVGGW